MGWKKTNNGVGEFYKFTAPGDTLMGTWVGTKDGKYGKNGIVITKDKEEQAFSLTAALQDLELVDKGSGVKIVYLGYKETKNGRPYKAFDVFMWDKEQEKDDPVSEYGSAEREESDMVGERFVATDDDVPF